MLKRQSTTLTEIRACTIAFLLLVRIVSIAEARPQPTPRVGLAPSGGTVRAVNSSAKHLSLRVSLPTGATLTGGGQLEVGKPDVPVFGRWVLVPNGTTLSIHVDPGEPAIVDAVDLPPVQPPRADSPGTPRSKTVVDAATYSTDADYPGALAWAEPVRTVRGQDCTVVWLCPYQYNPVTRRLSVHEDMVVHLDFDGQMRPPAGRLESSASGTVLRRLAVNAEQVLPAQRQADPKTRSGVNRLSVPTETTLDRVGNGQTFGCDYLIICDPAFLGAAEALVDWRRLIGFRSRYVTTAETGPTAAEIESHIDRSQKEWFPAPAYVLLLGDAEYIPCFYELPHASDEGRTDALMQGKVASDRYYGDTNDDGIADIFVGRLPVDTPEEAMTAVRRIIDYERAPPDPARRPEFYTSFAAVACFDDYAPEDGYADTRFVRTSEDIYLYLSDAGYDGTRVYSHDAAVEPTNWSTEVVFENDEGGGGNLPDYLLDPSFEWSANTAAIADSINKGAFLVTYRGHGSRLMRSVPRGWTNPGGWIRPEFQEHDAAALENGPLAPVVFSATCMTGWFDNEIDDERYDMFSGGSAVRTYETEPDSESLCESFITNPNGGAVAVIGATRVSYSGRNDRLVWGWMDAVWPDFIEYQNGSYGGSEPIYQMGPLFEYGKQYMLTKYSYEWDYTKTTIDEFVLFGDPAMEIRTRVPYLLTAGDVTHPSAVNAGQPADLTVSVSKGPNALAGARVTISRTTAPEDYWTDLTDDLGTVTFAGFATTQRGDYNVVVTAHDCVPYEGVIASETIGPGTLTVQRQVSKSDDDGHAADRMFLSLDADCLPVGASAADGFPTCGMIFRNVNIPRGSQILGAHLTVRSNADYYDEIAYCRIEAEASDHAESLSDLRSPDTLLTTVASVGWNMDEPWLIGEWYGSPDISAVVAEVVSRDGWSANDSMVILLSTKQGGGGNRCISSYDGGQAGAPKLEITYAVDRVWLVSGRVTTDGEGLAGVRIEGLPDVLFTDEEGRYSTEVYYGWSCLVTPSKPGYTFTPREMSLAGVTSDLTNNFEAEVRTFAISGRVMTTSGFGMSAVTVMANNGADSTETDSKGYYSLSVPYGWSGRISPSKPGYVFAAPSNEYAGVTSDRTGQNFVAPTRDISGYVSTAEGLPVSGVAILLSDQVTAGLTDSAGFYRVSVPYRWSGRIVLSKIGYVFDPEGGAFSDVTDDLTGQFYTAIPKTQTISGHVRAYDGSGISGVTVAASNGGGSDTTDLAGYYDLTVLYGWSGRVTPSSGEYMFIPAYQEYENLVGDRPDQDYARARTHTVSGYVRSADGAGIIGVTLTASDGGGTGITNSIGYYRLVVPREWSGRVAPAKTGYAFTPAHRDYTRVTYNRTNRNYSGQLTNEP